MGFFIPAILGTASVGYFPVLIETPNVNTTDFLAALINSEKNEQDWSDIEKMTYVRNR